MRFFICLVIAGCSVCSLHAQNKKGFDWNAYAELYYIFDFGIPENHRRPDFVYSHNRHNEFNLNLGYIQAGYKNERVKASLAFMAGTYSNTNLADEPGVLKNILEAYAGIKLSKNKNLWLDFGIMPSHIGFESARGADCITLTRSILADNSPYYSSGIKFGYTTENERWHISGLIINGWQRIQRVPGNQFPAFGHQLTFTPSKKVTLNSSSFIGNDFPEEERKLRYFHNCYGIFEFRENWTLTAGFDIGAEQSSKKSRQYYTWWSPVLLSKYRFNEKLSMAARVEFYADRNGVIITKQSPNGFQTMGYSLNIDYQISPGILWRLEARNFTSRDPIFRDKDGLNTQFNTFAGTAIAVSF